MLNDINVSITTGSFVALTGPSGSGKSTFLNLAALLDTPTRGELFLDGDDVARLPEHQLCAVRKDKIGMVFVTLCILTTSIAILFGVIISPRAWCSFCPMGTLKGPWEARDINSSWMQTDA